MPFMSALAVQGGYVYYSTIDPEHLWDGGLAILRVPVEGGAPERVVETPWGVEIGGLATDGTNVFWTTGYVAGSVMAAVIGEGVPIPLAVGEARPGTILVASGQLFWADYQPSGAVLTFGEPVP
jgi:hypothetical protein